MSVTVTDQRPVTIVTMGAVNPEPVLTDDDAPRIVFAEATAVCVVPGMLRCMAATVGMHGGAAPVMITTVMEGVTNFVC